jgi:hypothetical protein
MGLLDMFKNKWSAGKMTEEDRKKLFWYLKRKTSYSAWKRVADAFDQFAEIFENQVREEPIAKSGKHSVWGTNWETYYPEILKAQVLYEKALATLQQGDRSVFLYNERGIIRDASVISSSWHDDLVNHGPQGDHFFEGKYVEEMTAAMQEFFKARCDASGTQPMMADWAAPELWSTMWQDDFAKMPIPKILPDVPIPKTEILVRTGEEIPVFGIYEPQIKDGCMNCLPATGPAPSLPESDGTYATGQNLSVTWKLIWEDTRYQDGFIPAEENLYFPPESKTSPTTAPATTSDMLSALSGQRCPKDGHWAVMDDLQGKIVLKAGDKMPQHKGRDVTWVWVE